MNDPPNPVAVGCPACGQIVRSTTDGSYVMDSNPGSIHLCILNVFFFFSFAIPVGIKLGSERKRTKS